MHPPDLAAVAARSLSDDLRTVLALVAGVRVRPARCRRWVDEVLMGGAEPRHEAAVYLLATHYLALADRPAFDGLAWGWLSARGLGDRPVIRVRATTDALRLAIFAVESGWEPDLVGRLVTLVAQSRSTPVWVSLPDLARTGGRHAERLRTVLQAVDLTRPDGPLRRAALLLLSGVHELHRMEVQVGEGWALVANTAPDCRVATVFTGSPRVAPELRERVVATCGRLGLLTAVHSHDHGVVVMARFDDPSPVVSLDGPSTYPDDHLSAVAHVHSRAAAANHPGLLGLSPERVLDVFRTGPAVARQGRTWLVPPAPGATSRVR